MQNSNIPLISESKPIAERIREYNPYRAPPDLVLAKIHGNARRVCEPQFSNPELSPTMKCPCCRLPIKNKQHRLWCDPDDLAHLGVCFPLYFSYIKFCFIVLCICLSIAGIMNLIYNIMGENCKNYGNSFICTVSFMNVLDTTKEGMKNLSRQSLLNNATILVVLVAFEIYRFRQRKYAYRNMNKYYVGDFSLFLSFLPSHFNQEEIEKFVNFHLSRLNRPITKVVKVYYLHQLGEYAKLYSTKRDLIIKKNKFPRKASYINSQIDNINTQLRELEKSYDNLTNTATDTRVIVVLESAKAAKTLQSYFRKKYLYTFSIYCRKYLGINLISKDHLYNGNYIRVTKAPEPSDIKWENLSYSSTLKTKRRILTAVVIGFLITIGFAVLVLLKKLLKQVKTTDEDIGEYVSVVVSLVGALCVAITNTILGIYTRRFVRYEKHKTQTSFFVTVGKRISAVLVINMTLTTLLANMAQVRINTSFFKISVTGLFYDVFFLFITNSYMSSIFNYFDIMWGVRLYQRYKAIKSGVQCKLTQLQAHTLFEGHPVDMALRFANVNKTLIFTGLFIPFIPLGIIFSMIGFIITYWVDKYLLLRRYVCANRLSFALPKAMFITAEWFIVAYAFGNIAIFFIPVKDGDRLVIKNLNNSYFWGSLFIFISVLIYKFLIPSNSIHNIFTKTKVQSRDVRYEDVKDQLPEDYEKFHPVYRRHGMLVSEMLGVDDEDDRNMFPMSDSEQSPSTISIGNHEEDMDIELNEKPSLKELSTN